MLEVKVETFLKRHCFQLEHKKIIVGVSGGPDSLALLHFLMKQREKNQISIIAAHVDHMFRGEESYADAMFVKEFCYMNKIPFEMVRSNIPERMERTGRSSQSEAREARYEFFAAVMKKYNYPYLALGHHGDDQIETILMRLTRGSSGTARAGMPFSRPFSDGVIFRPFLTLTKEELEQYCQDHDLSPRYDPSNSKGIYSRNRFRKTVLPFLKEENRHAHEHFQRYSEELHSDERYLQELTIQQMNTVMKIDKNGKVTADIKRFVLMPLPLQRRGIQLILNYLYIEKPNSLAAIHIEQIFSLIRGSRASGQLDLPNGLKVVRSYNELIFLFEIAENPDFSFELDAPGEVNLPNGDMITVSAVVNDVTALNKFQAIFNENHVKWPIIIRTRRQGDRMTLKGMKGSKKIKDIFIDQKVPHQDRAAWPVVTDGEGSIIWLPGLKKSSIEGSDEHAKKYIQLSFQKKDFLGGTNHNDEK